jgi:hypothetical protein
MKTTVIIGAVILSVIIIITIILMSIKREHYNAISPDWKWNSLENSLDEYPEKCIAKPGKNFRQC